MRGPFRHTRSAIRFWKTLVQQAARRVPTPFYIFAEQPIIEGLKELDKHFADLPVRHWLSCKTQPLAPLLDWWRRAGRPVEVVSEFELNAALASGFAPADILVNGPAKHRWLASYGLRGLNVNLDSLNESRALAAPAAQLAWRVGLRLNTSEEFDPELPQHPTQFGLSFEEAAATLRVLRRRGIQPSMIHFHLRTNVGSAGVYQRALEAAAQMAQLLGLGPAIVNCGGGFPAPNVGNTEGLALDRAFRLGEMRRLYRSITTLFPSVREIWLENGRWLCARSGVLVTRVLDLKCRRGVRHLVCDGGRTMNAMLAAWEEHEIKFLPERRGRRIPTIVVGPTCMAYDVLARRPMPRALRAGDLLLWLDAGAYHLQWQTRFSHGLCPVFWHERDRLTLVRDQEPFASWWKTMGGARMT